ncbi:MAG: glycosyltransferase [Fimbriimonadaceae bacterium]|nr:glycosyltransferase [Chitinophagales bacterium]
MRKIIFTVTNDLTYDQRMQRICTTLANAGYAVTLIGFLKNRSVRTDDRNFEQVRLKVFFKKGKLFFIEYNMKLFFWLLFKRFDIYCGIDLDTLIPVFINAKLKGKPNVYDAHEYYTELPEIVDRPLIKKIWLLVEKTLLPRIKYNYTVGNTIADILSKKYKRDYVVIRNVPVLKDNATVTDKENSIIYQGALNKGRGIENLMLAMKDVDATLYIAGQGDLSIKLRTMANSLDHKDKIRFLGYVRPEELKQYTNKAKIGVNLVENMGLSYYYSLSNKFFDYIHAGIPQVTMNFPEYAGLNTAFNVAVLIDDLVPETINNAINRLLNDEVLYHQLQLNTQKAKTELNWQQEEKKLIQFYKTIE